LHTRDAAAAVRLLEFATEHLRRAKAEVRSPQVAASFISILGFVVVLIAVNPLFMHITVAYFQSAIGAVRVRPQLLPKTRLGTDSLKLGTNKGLPN
jgi:hypothetical protein